MYSQSQFTIKTPGRGLLDITPQIKEAVKNSRINIGLCHVFLHHTSASLILCENDDGLVQKDLETFLSRLIPDGDPLFQHIAEGPDDMPSHVRTVLTTSFLNIPITEHQLGLGTWQGIYLWEHRIKPHTRKITITLQGELC